MTNVKSLLALYVKMGGSLTDTYSDVAGGVPVGQYSLISDAILACSKKYSSGGGGLPADFPAEGIANANKFLGFDNSGDYAALAAPSGAEKFVVTLTQENDTWTADKTVAEIVAADAANQVVVAKYPRNGLIVDIPLNMAMEFQGMFGALFVGLISPENDNKVVAVQCMNKGSGEAITIVEQQIPTSSYAPLIVTLTEDQQNPGTYVGDKTYKEVYDAFMAGKRVAVVLGTEGLSVSGVGYGDNKYTINIADLETESKGNESDYITVSF